MATYAAYTDIQNRIENLDASLTQAILEDYIEEAEQILKAVMGADFLSGYDAAKHGILHSATIAWAAMHAITFNPAGFTDISEANLMLDVLSFQWEQTITVLRDKSVVEYLLTL